MNTDGPSGEAPTTIPEALEWAAKTAGACRCAVEVREIMPDPELAVPQAVSATAASKATDANPTRDARNDPFMSSPSTVDRSLRLWRRASTARG